MKRYVFFILAVYLILLAIPIPVFFASKSNKPYEGAPHSESPGDNTTQTTAEDNHPEETAAENEQAETDVFKVLNIADNRVYELTARELMIGSTAAEMYPTYHIEALKAQAAAVYSYYCVRRTSQRQNPDAALNGADFADTNDGFPIYYSVEQLRERWGDNFDAYYKKMCEAADDVEGKQLAHNGQPVLAIYHSISSGITEDAATVWGGGYPYLLPVPSPGDKLSPNYESVVSFSPEELRERIKETAAEFDPQGDAAEWLGEIEKSESGTVTGVVVGGTELTGRQLRQALGLRSYCFDVKWQDGRFYFTVYGYGHNVGMSQYGADYLARQGSNWMEILKYYYTGITIE